MKSIIIRGNAGRFRSHALSTVSAIALVAASLGAAQAAQQTAASQQAEEELSEVVVTGSRIVREGYEAPTPLSVVDVAAIQASATQNIAEFVNTMPVFNGSQAPNTGQSGISPGTAGVSTLSLRNLGGGRTLVLLDGQRIVGSLISGVVDINSLPQQLVQRVEVVTGGASAVYGSDAITGVVNFILDKEYTGIKGEISGGVTSYLDDENYKINLSAGFPFAGGKGHVIASGEQVYKAGIFDGPQRDWAFTGIGWVINPAYTATNGQPRQLLFPDRVGNSNGTPGGIIVSGPLKGTYFGPGGSVNLLNYGDTVFDPSMHGGDWEYTDVHERMFSLDPIESRQNVFTRVQYNIGDNVTVFASASWGSGRTKGQAWAQFQPGNAASGANAIKADNAFIPDVVRARMTTLGVTTLTLGSYNFDAPSTNSDNQRMLNRNVVGANGNFDAFGKNWTWDAYFQNGYSRDSINVRGVWLTNRRALAIDAVRDPNGRIICRSTLTNPTNGCVPWNLFGEGVNSDAALAYLRGGKIDSGPYSYQKLIQNVWEATLGGEPFEVGAGPVSVSLNAVYRVEKSGGIVDANAQASNWFGGNYKPLTAQYNVKEASAETVIPLANGQSWVDNWDLNAAVRLTDYSASGFVATWKVGTTYTPIPDIRLRVTRSRDIRAPNLAELYAGGVPTVSNLARDPFTTTSPTYRFITVGNTLLEPEKADTLGIGFVISPSFIPNLTVSADYWNIKIDGGIGNIGVQATIDLCFSGQRSDLCQFITRFAPTGVAPYATIGQVDTIQSSGINIGHQDVKGIDLEGSYQWEAGDMVDGWAGKINLHGNATVYLRNYTNPGYPGANLSQTVGENSGGGGGGGGPPHWRLSSSLDYTLDPINVSLTMRKMSSGTYNNNWIVCTTGCPTSTVQNETVNANSLAGYTYLDIGFQYRFGLGEAVDATAFFNVRNIMNTDPVLVAQRTNPFIQLPMNSSAYDTLGRVFRTGLRFKM